MAFVLEDGSGLPNSNGYVSAAFVDAYVADRGGNDTWDNLGQAEKEAAIVRATDYIDGGRYRFVGIRKLTSQALEWPRVDARYTDDDRAALDVPVEVEKACAELALITADGTDLNLQPVYDDSGRFVEAKTEIVGPIQESTRYSQGGGPATFKKYPRVDKLLRFLLIGGHDLLRA